ncbi:hypothetical protein NBRC116493_01110 [Aurantivibrio infirmus]
MFSVFQRIMIRLTLLISCLSCAVFFTLPLQAETSSTHHSAGGFSTGSLNTDSLNTSSFHADNYSSDNIAQRLPTSNTARIAIIIDDIGYSWQKGEQIAQLPGPVTVSILPHSPFGARLASLFHEAGKEIMLHAPMSNILNKPLDEGALTTEMSKQVFLHTLRDSLDSLPHVVGVNNHMGSLLTQHEQPMRWLMAELKHQQLYFIDSRTSPNSQAWEVAQKYLLPSSKRDFFLDHERGEAAVKKQFDRFINSAKLHGQGIAIAHPYPETLLLLERQIPQLSLQGIELTSVSELLAVELEDFQDTPINTMNSAVDRQTDYIDRIRTTISHKK